MKIADLPIRLIRPSGEPETTEEERRLARNAKAASWKARNPEKAREKDRRRRARECLL